MAREDERPTTSSRHTIKAAGMQQVLRQALAPPSPSLYHASRHTRDSSRQWRHSMRQARDATPEAHTTRRSPPQLKLTRKCRCILSRGFPSQLDSLCTMRCV